MGRLPAEKGRGVSPKRILTALPDRTMPLAVLAAVRGIIAPAGCSTIEYGKRKGFYTDAYNAAYDSITKQYDLWDTAEKIVATSASSINSALESQITYWDSYNQNLESLNARAADINGLSAVIASFADGSKDSVNAIAGMASASDADLAKMVQNYQELQEAQKTTSESIADLETGMSNAMDEIAQNVADSVVDMNLSDETKESAQATIQGFVDGAEGMLPRVQTVFSKIASAASTALAGAGGSYSGNIPGYAVGTESAAPGFAIVGENGP